MLTSALKQSNALNKSLVVASQRSFGKPGGPPGQEPTKIPEKRGQTILEKIIEDPNNEFVMGPPIVPNKTWGAPRDTMLHKLEPHMDVFARKLREVYQREGTIPQIKSYLNPLRMRQPTDTLENCMKEQTMPGVIHGRDEFSDVDLVWPWKTPFRVTKSEHAYVRPWYMIHPQTEEEIRVTAQKIDYHLKSKRPYFIEFQRYIVGRPNLLKIPLAPVQEDKSLHFVAGAAFNFHVKYLWVWCFNDVYPGRIDVNCSHLSTNMPIKIGDVEKMLPYGMYLHKMYNHQKVQAVVTLDITNKYIGRRNLIIEQSDQIREQRRRMQTQLLEKKRAQRTTNVVKSVPKYIQSSKTITADKKNAGLDELLERSKEGGAGKGGRGR